MKLSSTSLVSLFLTLGLSVSAGAQAEPGSLMARGEWEPMRHTSGGEHILFWYTGSIERIKYIFTEKTVGAITPPVVSLSGIEVFCPIRIQIVSSLDDGEQQYLYFNLKRMTRKLGPNGKFQGGCFYDDDGLFSLTFEQFDLRR